MDIYSAQSHVNKLLKFVEELADTRPRMYEKSRERLRELASTCDRVIQVISNLLQEEILNNDSDSEFEGDTEDLNAFLNSYYDSMQNQISQLKKFIDVKSEETKVTSSSKRRAFNEYRKCLTSLKMTNITAVDDLEDIISRWFTIRFTGDKVENFRYNIKRFPEWLRDIVILYGYYIHQDRRQEFLGEFNRWLNDLENTNKNDNFAVPYMVYEFNRDAEPRKLTLDAVIIWDMLLDSGLRSLCNQGVRDLYPEENCVYNVCDKLNPDVLDAYRDYNLHPGVLMNFSWYSGGYSS